MEPLLGHRLKAMCHVARVWCQMSKGTGFEHVRLRKAKGTKLRLGSRNIDSLICL